MASERILRVDRIVANDIGCTFTGRVAVKVRYDGSPLAAKVGKSSTPPD